MIFLNLLLFNVTAGGVTAQRPNPMVRVPNGVLQGTWQVSTKGRLYASFQGVPYAGPPIEEYRFREPQPLKSWSGVWDATKPSSACLQYNSIAGLIIGSEDCLFLNVHTPQLQSNASLPVLVFLHGGAFMFGDGATYKATNIIDWDMVVVTMNYRLGPLGFLSTGDEVVPGNNGLKDQSFALHWIKNNIMMFGGNPDSITLTGNSAGGASVHYHYLSPLSRGTFTRGICFSGSALNPQHLSTKPVEKARTLAHIVGCPINSSEEMVDCLKKQPGEVIINAQIKMFAWKVNLFTPFTPCVEAPGVLNAFLQRDPYYATKNGFMMNLTLIATDTAEEGLYPAAAYQTNPFLLPDLEAHWDELADKIFVYSDTLPVSRRHEVAKAIKQHYLGGKPVSQETFPQLVQALGDRLFLDGVGKMVQFHAARSGQPTYVYRYAYRASRSLSNLLAHNNVDYGVSHADDVVYIFHQFKPETKGDFAIIDVLMNLIYSFSTHGTPTPKNGPAWLPVTPSAKELKYLDILAPNKLVMNSTTDYGQKHFWDKLGFNEGENGRG